MKEETDKCGCGLDGCQMQFLPVSWPGSKRKKTRAKMSLELDFFLEYFFQFFLGKIRIFLILWNINNHG